MNNAVLHYFHDPLCGWCYGAEPLVRAASAKVRIKLHGGGLWEQNGRLAGDKRAMIKANDRRIHVLTGQVFGDGYLDGLLDDPTTVFHSRPTIAAILTAEKLDPDAALLMLYGIQTAHYVDGRKVVERVTLLEIAANVGLDVGAFDAALDTVAVNGHIEETRKAMHQGGLQGYPSFLLERDGVMQSLTHDRCYGHPDKFVAQLTSCRDCSINSSREPLSYIHADSCFPLGIS